ncbi:cytochrome C oxidase subunit IV family protein [Nocardia cerradoensis]|uniref:cytochrome C oxidase subunit IV family protein n=1 Tax=Nocardia cerradoensis TaxID=85688 RepID=UPI0002F3BDE1|nr:cytochrome C oxidase subunit IV family protein [Nocardia cerradoensis]NKY42519.1 cytochrome C oxidase subunit IV family protein [Nocardia cerradoensis]
MVAPTDTSDAARHRRDKRFIIYSWAALTAITVLTWRLAPGHAEAHEGTGGKALVAAIVVLGMIKCRVITHSFMEVRRAPRWLGIVTDTWLVIVWAVLLGIYLY